MTMTPDHIEVFYVDRRNGWATAQYDAEGNQLGEACYSYRKTWAIKEAHAMAGGIIPIAIYRQDGFEERIINGACQ